MTHTYVWHYSFVCVAWLIRVRVMTHSFVSQLVQCRVPECRFESRISFPEANESCCIWKAASANEQAASAFQMHDCRFESRISFAEALTPFKCDMTHLVLRHDSFDIALTPFKCDMTQALTPFKCDMTHESCRIWKASELQASELYQMSHVALIFVESPIRTFAMTHSYVWHDVFIHVIWLVRMHGMTRSYAWHDIFVFCGTTQSYVCYDAFVHVTWHIHAWLKASDPLHWLTHV